METHVVSDSRQCVTCCLVIRDRYLLVDVKGNRRPALALVEKFYGVSLADDSRNYCSYVCRTCKRKIERWEQAINTANKIKESIVERSQKIKRLATGKKRVFPSTPNAISQVTPSRITPRQTMKRTKTDTTTPKVMITPTHIPKPDISYGTPRQCYTWKPSSQEKTDKVSTVRQRNLLSSSRKRLQFTSNTAVKTSHRMTRKQTFTFRTSVNAVPTLRRVIKALCNGTVQKAVQMLLTSDVLFLRNGSIKGLAAAVKLEGKKHTKTLCSLKNTHTLTKKAVLDEVKTKLPILWTAFTSFCGKSNELAENHSLMALSITIHARNRNFNGLQELISLAMYQSQLQKEGYEILSKLGVTMSYRTVLNKLDKGALMVNETMKNWKESLENQDIRVNQSNQESNVAVAVHVDHPYHMVDTVNENYVPVDQADHTYCCSTQEQSLQSSGCEANAYRFNIDNLDYEVKVRNMTSEHQNRSKHYVQLPLGILEKNENKTNDIIDVMEYLQKLVPGTRTEAEVEEINVREERSQNLRQIPLGGDQLTVERIRGAHMACLDGETPEERLEGVFAMIEDFHEKMNFLQAAMDKLYTMASARDGGTLSQLRNLINRRNVVGKVTDDYHAVGEFFDLVTDVHIVVAITEYLNIENFDSNFEIFPRSIHMYTRERKHAMLKNLIGCIVDKYVLNPMTENLRSIEENTEGGRVVDQDHVYNHATAILKYGLLRRISVMTTAAGDGERCLRNWRYAMLVYHSSHKIKYRLEAFLLQASTKALLSPRLSHQITWNRFINLSGGEGNNLDGDYVMELLNRLAKKRMKSLGPNHTSNAVARIGKTLMYCDDIEKHLLQELGVAFQSRRHTKASVDSDIRTMYEELKHKSSVFKWNAGRAHGHFPNFNADIFSNINPKELHLWINGKKKEYSTGKWAF